MVDLGMIHGRFQPFHNGHFAYLKVALAESNKLLVGITNPYPAVIYQDDSDTHRHTSVSNPFSFYLRMRMVQESILRDPDLRDKYDDITIVPFPINRPELWKYYIPFMKATQFIRVNELWDKLKKETFEDYGFDVIDLPKEQVTSGTKVRCLLNNSDPSWQKHVPEGTKRVLEEWSHKSSSAPDCRHSRKAQVPIGMIHGRFQPFHVAHFHYLKEALARCHDRMIIGVANPDPLLTAEVNSNRDRHRSDANPFSYYDRVTMIRETILKDPLLSNRWRNITITPFPVNLPSQWKYFIPEPPLTQFMVLLNQWDHQKKKTFEEYGYSVIELSGTQISNESISKGFVAESDKVERDNTIPCGARETVEHNLKDLVKGVERRMPLKIFFICSNNDIEFRDELRRHLAPFQTCNEVGIIAKDPWECVPTEKFKEADIYVLLISKDFLNSARCLDETKSALARREEAKAIVISVLVRSSIFRNMNLELEKRSIILPRGGKPVEEWVHRDAAWVDVASGLLNEMQSLQRPRGSKEKLKLTIGSNFYLDRIVGRDEDMENAINALERKQMVVIRGKGGCGKSTLAQMVVNEFEQRIRSFDVIAWVDVRDYDPNTGKASKSDPKAKKITATMVFDMIGRAIGCAQQINLISDVNIKQQRLIDLLEGRRTLLVFDNYESLLFFVEEERCVTDFLFSILAIPDRNILGAVRVLVTTREIPRRWTHNKIEIYNLKGLSYEDSMRILRSCPGFPVLRDDQNQRIYQLLDGLPKYLVIAGNQLSREVFQNWEQRVTQIGPSIGTEEFYDDFFNPTWQLLSDDQRKIVLAITYFYEKTTSEPLRYVTGIDQLSFLNALGEMPGSAFEMKEQAYWLHSLTDGFCRRKMRTEEYQDYARESSGRFIAYIVRLVQEAQSPESVGNEIGNIRTASRLCLEWNLWEQAAKINKLVREILKLHGYWEDRLYLSDNAIVAYKKLRRHKEQAQCLIYDKTWVLLRLERTERARESLETALELLKI